MKVMISVIFGLGFICLGGCSGAVEKSENLFKGLQIRSGSDLTQEEIDEKAKEGQMRSMR